MNIAFTQTKEYLEWHQAVGTKTGFLEFFRDIEDQEDFQIDNESTKEKYATAAYVILELRIGKVLYVPYGPVFEKNFNVEEKNKVIQQLHIIATKENCVFVRLEMGGTDKYNFVDRKKAAGKAAGSSQAKRSGRRNCIYQFRPSQRTFAKEGIFQPRMEWWLDLHESEEELLNRVHKDHRYSIRRAEKENIRTRVVSENMEDFFEIFWTILQETATRDEFILYDKKYYEQIFKNKNTELKKFLVFTLDKNEEGVDRYWSVALIVISDHVANLVFAGSVSEGREKGFNHLMQWEAIKESKKHGCEIYNFGGITENGYGKQTLEGVTKFKKKFGGYAKFHGDFLDLPIKKIKYMLYLLRKMI